MNIWQLHLYSRRNYASTFFNHFSHFISKIPWLAVLSQWIPNSIFWRNGGRKMPNIVKRKSPPNKFLNFFSLLHCFIFHSFFSSFFFFFFLFLRQGLSLGRPAWTGSHKNQAGQEPRSTCPCLWSWNWRCLPPHPEVLCFIFNTNTNKLMAGQYHSGI